MPSLPIEHVVDLMLENAAFDRMLGCMTEVHPGMAGVDPARPQTSPDLDGGEIAQAPTTSRNIDCDPKHYLPNGLAQLAGGTNRGFVTDFARTHPTSTSAERREIMGYYPRGFLPALHTLAEHFVVCDHWFSSLPGPTWINRLFAHAGTSLGHVSEPGSLFSHRLHLYDERTLYDELHDAGVPWRIYFGDVPQSLCNRWSGGSHRAPTRRRRRSRPTSRTPGGTTSWTASRRLFGMSHHFQSLIQHPGRRGALMARAHEALEDGWSQAKLATDR
ncbi:MAG: Phospholipase, partial [Rhodospirillales bacterium]|nr:Phospholipase [Rhodospirillales bacterium]